MERGRIPALDGIRGLAVTLVLLWHGAFATFTGSNTDQHRSLRMLVGLGAMTWSGVDLFFVLSGFLIGGILLDASETKTFFSTFYLRRFFRIIPLYLLAICSAWAVLLSFHNHLPEYLGTQIAPPIVYLTFLQNFWAAIHGTNGNKLLAATWSLAVEEQFYLTLPVLIRVVSRRTLWIILGATVILSPILRVLAYSYLENGRNAAYVLTPCRADSLAFGVICALLVRSPQIWASLCKRKTTIHIAFAVGSAILLSILLRGYEFQDNRYFGLEYTVLATTYSCFLLTALIPGRVAEIFSNKWLRSMGAIAYCVYLVHMPLIAFAQESLMLFLPRRWFTVVAGSLIGIAVSILVGKFSWKYFESRLVAYGHRYGYAADGPLDLGDFPVVVARV